MSPIWDYYPVCEPINSIFLVEPAPCVEEPVGDGGGDNKTERDETEKDEMKGDVIGGRYQDHLLSSGTEPESLQFFFKFLNSEGVDDTYWPYHVYIYGNIWNTPCKKISLFNSGCSRQRFDNHTQIYLFSDVRCEIVVFGKTIRFIHFLSIPVLVRCVLIPENSLNW